MIIEQIFSLPGIGSLLIGSITTRDYAIIQLATLIFALLVVVVNLIADLAYRRARSAGVARRDDARAHVRTGAAGRTRARPRAASVRPQLVPARSASLGFLAFVLAAIFAPLLTPYDPITLDATRACSRRAWRIPSAPISSGATC